MSIPFTVVTLAVATGDIQLCIPATDTFTGLSTTTLWGKGKGKAFETCYKLGNDAPFKRKDLHCWSKSYYNQHTFPKGFYQCIPDGDDWHGIDANLPGDSCGSPCQNIDWDPWS